MKEGRLLRGHSLSEEARVGGIRQHGLGDAWREEEASERWSHLAKGYTCKAACRGRGSRTLDCGA